MTQETEPLLQTYWLPSNSQEESAAVFSGWILFAITTLLIVLGATVF